MQFPPVEVFIAGLKATFFSVAVHGGLFAKFATKGCSAPFGGALAWGARQIASQGICGEFLPVDFAGRDSLDESPLVADRAFVVQIESSMVG